MTTLNADASRIALEAGATGATDVTGFGLLGHLSRAMQSSAADGVVDPAAVPLLDGTRELCEAGAVPGGTGRNLAWLAGSIDGEVDGTTLNLLADPQTSGGLLFGVSPAEVDGALRALGAAGHRGAVVGRVDAGSGRIRVAAG
jgi:selenide,water dikinase